MYSDSTYISRLDPKARWPYYYLLMIWILAVMSADWPVLADRTWNLLLCLGTCESFFPFESNRPFTTQAVTQPNGLQAYRTACYRPMIRWRWRLALWVLVYFNSVIKSVKQSCCTLILLPKSTLNANLTTTNRFVTNESDHQYESNLESDVRFEIESNHEASQVPTYVVVNVVLLIIVSRFRTNDWIQKTFHYYNDNNRRTISYFAHL